MANPKFVTLQADTDQPVTLDRNFDQVEVTLVANAATTYFNTGGVAIGTVVSPVDGNHVLNSTLISKVVDDITAGAESVVHLRSTGTPTVCVLGL